jgi:hypothetical protein
MRAIHGAAHATRYIAHADGWITRTREVLGGVMTIIF